MKRIFGAAAVVLAFATSSYAVPILQGKLVSTVDASDPTLWHVQVQVSSTGAGTDATDGGVSGAQFDLISKKTGASSAVAAGAGPLAGKSKINWAISSNDFSLTGPNRTDAIPALNPGNALYNGDGDLDSLGSSFGDNSHFSNATIGKSGFQTIATIDWNVPVGNFDTLDLVLIAPSYYDFSQTGNNFQGLYAAANVSTTGAVVSVVPEPASLALMGLGSLAAIGFIRRKNGR